MPPNHHFEGIAAREGVEGEGHKDGYGNRDESNNHNRVLAGGQAVVLEDVALRNVAEVEVPVAPHEEVDHETDDDGSTGYLKEEGGEEASLDHETDDDGSTGYLTEEGGEEASLIMNHERSHVQYRVGITLQ